jgi:hypothetical protein
MPDPETKKKFNETLKRMLHTPPKPHDRKADKVDKPVDSAKRRSSQPAATSGPEDARR